MVFACAVLGFSDASYGQFGSDLFDEFNSNADRTVGFDSADAPPLQRAGDGANWRARVGHLAFGTFGREDSLTHVELMPMIPLDNAAVFSDWRLFFDNNGQVGANLGVGYRQWVEEIDHVVGASFWYDGDNTTTQYFNQLGLSFEMLGDDWDLTSNVYVPVGSDEKNYSVRNTNSRIDPTDNTVRFDRVRDVGESMPGIDLEFGFLIPTDFAHEHEVRAYAGWYYFEGDTSKDINGVRVRLQGDVTSNMTAQVEFTDDDTFGTNVIFGGSIVLPGSLSAERPAARRRERHLGRFAQRNYNVIVSRNVRTQQNITAINPVDGGAYAVQQVTSAVDLMSSRDILLVQAGTTLAAPAAIILENGQFLLGDKTGQTIIAEGFGTIAVPDLPSGTGPVAINNVMGNAVTLASNSRVSGLTINDATGHGIIGSGITGATLSDLTVQGSGLDNLFLENVAGPLTLAGLTLGDAMGSSFHLDGSSADVALSGAISNTLGRSVRIENTSADTTVDLRNSTIQDSGAGVLISGVAGDVQLNDVTVTGGTGKGIEVMGNSGTVIFGGLTTVSGRNDSAIHVHDTVDLVDIVDDPLTPENESTVGIIEGQVFFNEIDVTTSGQTGLLASNASSLQIINGTINATNMGAVADISDSLIDVRLVSIFADGGPFAVNIANTTGTFAALGDGTGATGSGGLIQNTVTALTLQNADLVFTQFVDFDMNQHVLSDSGSRSVGITSSFITNTIGGAPALNAIFQTQNTKAFELSSSTIDGTNLIPVLDAGFDAVDSYNFGFATNSITSTAGDVFRLTTQASGAGASLALNATGNQITLNDDVTDAFDINWNGTSATTLTSNTITGNDTLTTGLRFNGASTTDQSIVNLQNNVFRFNGTNGTATNIVAAGQSQLTVARSTLEFNGANGTGMSFTLQDTASVAITSNLFTDNAGGATGVLFTTIADQSSLRVENNLFNFNVASGVTQGIRIQAVGPTVPAGPAGTISLFGNVDNVINGAASAFSINGASTGGFPVNGVFVP